MASFANWKLVVREVAYYYGFTAREIWDMDIDELLFWYQGLFQVLNLE